MGRWRALHVSCHIHRDHRTILWGWCSSLTFMWMLGKELCLTGFQGKHFYPVSPLACPKLASWGIVLHFQTLVGLWKNGFSPKNNTGCVWSCYSLHHGHGMTKCLSKYWWVSTSAAPVAPCLCWKYFTSVGGVFKKKKKENTSPHFTDTFLFNSVTGTECRLEDCYSTWRDGRQIG